MKIGSIHKTSLIDYPGKISTLIGTQGCNMYCPWCHNFYLIPYEFTKDSEIIEEKAFLSFLTQRVGLLEGVVITGGEPSIHPDLPEFCDKVKALGFKIKLDTNGSNPSMLNRLLKAELVDYIAMDVKTDLDQYPKLLRDNVDPDEIVDSIDILMSAGMAYEFRTTCVSPFVTVKNIDKIAMLIKGAQNYFLQKGKSTRCVNLNGKYSFVDENQIIELQHIAKSYVLKCEIR